MSKGKIAILCIFDLSVILLFQVLLFWSTTAKNYCESIDYTKCFANTSALFFIVSVSFAISYLVFRSFNRIIAWKVASLLILSSIYFGFNL